MKNKVIAVILSLSAVAAFAAVDVNRASQAELESVKGIGPQTSTTILAERQKAPFRNWNDLVTRVGGVGPASAQRFSADGLTVNGGVYPTASHSEAPMSEKAASGARRAASATAAAAGKAASATKAVAGKAASATRAGAATVKENVKEQKDAVKENYAESKAKREAKKASAP